MTTDDSGIFTLANAPTEPPAPATDADHLSDARTAVEAARKALTEAREEMANAATCIARSRWLTGAVRSVNNARHEASNCDEWLGQALTDLDTLLSLRGA